MADAEVLNVTVRESRGKRNSRRMRNAGNIPAVLYGHGGESVSLTVSTDEFDTAIRHGGKLVALKGAVDESALIREIQWDTFGRDVLHIDFFRVKAGQTTQLNVAVELRGQAPGLKEGGIVSHVLHEVTLTCPVASLPDKLVVNVNTLALGQAVHAGDLELPEGAVLDTDASALIVHCIEPVAELDEDSGDASGAEPEVIGRKADEESGDE
jgi:large subunit ribosomal protein L25